MLEGEKSPVNLSRFFRGRAAAGLLALGVLVAGCTAPSATPPASGPRQSDARPEQRTLILASGRPTDALVAYGTRTDNEVSEMVMAGLVFRNTVTFQEEPWLAEARPTTQDGSWRINPDGTMITTYRLRPNIRWHDGTPFSSQDFVFGREAKLDPQLALGGRRQVQLMDRIETPDDQTLVIHWNQSYPWADRLFRTELLPLPRHVLEPIYRADDYERFENSAYWNREFVGTGPYRVLNFQPAAQLDLEAFPEYFLGRPKIDRVTMLIIEDTNVMLTRVLTDEVHVTLRNGLSVEGGLTAKEQWEAQGQGQVVFTPINWRWVNLSGMNPWFDDRPVRQAMLHAIDRNEMVRVLSRGQEQVIHTPISPFRPQFQRVNAAITTYAYDPQRAQQLLAEAGWARGPDGVLVNRQGERFSFEARAAAGDSEAEQLQAATISYWQAIGAELTINNMPARVLNSEDYRNRWPGAYWAIHNIQVEDWHDRFHTSNLPTAENRWARENVSRWTNSDKDAILDEMNASLDRNRYDDLVVEFLKLFTRDLPHLPLKYASEVTTVHKSVKGVTPRIESGGENARTWNIHVWEWA